MNRIRAKLKSQAGASITFALLLFMVCAVVGSVVLTAGTAAAGRLSEMARMDQRYYSVTSAAQLLRNTIDGQTVTVIETKEFIANTDGTETQISPTDSVIDGGESSPLLQYAAGKLTGTDAITAADSNELTVSFAADGTTLDVDVLDTLQPDGTMTLKLSSVPGAGDTYVYSLILTFTADIKETVDSKTVETFTPSGKTTTRTEMKTTSMIWKLNNIGKAVAEPVSSAAPGSGG